MKKSKEAKIDGTPITKKAALGFIVPLCLLSVLLSALVISVSNDMYAFVKPDREISVRIDAPVSAKELSRLLKESGVIRNEFVFELIQEQTGRDFCGGSGYTQRHRDFGPRSK